MSNVKNGPYVLSREAANLQSYFDELRTATNVAAFLNLLYPEHAVSVSWAKTQSTKYRRTPLLIDLRTPAAKQYYRAMDSDTPDPRYVLPSWWDEVKKQRTTSDRKRVVRRLNTKVKSEVELIIKALDKQAVLNTVRYNYKIEGCYKLRLLKVLQQNEALRTVTNEITMDHVIEFLRQLEIPDDIATYVEEIGAPAFKNLTVGQSEDTRSTILNKVKETPAVGVTVSGVAEASELVAALLEDDDSNIKASTEYLVENASAKHVADMAHYINAVKRAKESGGIDLLRMFVNHINNINNL